MAAPRLQPIFWLGGDRPLPLQTRQLLIKECGQTFSPIRIDPQYNPLHQALLAVPMTTLTFDAFKAQKLAEGYDEVLLHECGPYLVNEPHNHRHNNHA